MEFTAALHCFPWLSGVTHAENRDSFRPQADFDGWESTFMVARDGTWLQVDWDNLHPQGGQWLVFYSI